MLGLFTRLVSVPLFINMMVATLAVRLKKVGGLDEFVELDEPLYALSFLWLFFSAPGGSASTIFSTRCCAASTRPELAPRPPA